VVLLAINHGVFQQPLEAGDVNSKQFLHSPGSEKVPLVAGNSPVYPGPLWVSEPPGPAIRDQPILQIDTVPATTSECNEILPLTKHEHELQESRVLRQRHCSGTIEIGSYQELFQLPYKQVSAQSCRSTWAKRYCCEEDPPFPEK
jgi:hypothetical protein